MRRVLEASRRNEEARLAKIAANELAAAVEASRRNEEARLAKIAANQEAAILEISRKEAEAKAEANLKRLVEGKKKETGAEYEKNLMETVTLALTDNPYQYQRDAGVLLMEIEAIFTASPYTSTNTREQKEVKNELREIQGRLGGMVTGDEAVDEEFVLTLPRILRKTYSKLGLNRETVLRDHANYQSIKKMRDNMDSANVAKRQEVLVERRTERGRAEAMEKAIAEALAKGKSEEEKEMNTKRLENADAARKAAKSAMETTQKRYNQTKNPKMRERFYAEQAVYEKAQKEYTQLRNEYLRKYPGSAAAWADGGTRRRRKQKKSTKTRKHK